MNSNDYRRPLYQQFAALIRQKIADQEFLPGEKIPSERVLATKFNINRMTVKKGLNNLVAAGILTRQQGKGTFVSPHLRRSYPLSFTHASSFSSAWSKEGHNLTTKVLRFIERGDSQYLRKKLNLETTENVYGIHRLRIVAQKPIAVEYTYVPDKYFPDFLQTDFRHIGLYDYMEKHGQVPTHFQQYQILMHPLSPEAKLLDLAPKDYVFKINFSTVNQDNQLIEFTESYFNAKLINLNYDYSL